MRKASAPCSYNTTVQGQLPQSLSQEPAAPNQIDKSSSKLNVAALSIQPRTSYNEFILCSYYEDLPLYFNKAKSDKRELRVREHTCAARWSHAIVSLDGCVSYSGTQSLEPTTGLNHDNCETGERRIFICIDSKNSHSTVSCIAKLIRNAI